MCHIATNSWGGGGGEIYDMVPTGWPAQMEVKLFTKADSEQSQGPMGKLLPTHLSSSGKVETAVA